MSRRLLLLYIASLSGLATLFLMQARFHVPDDSVLFWNGFAVLIALALLAEGFSLPQRVGTVTSAVSFVPYLAAVLLFGPAPAMVLAGLSEFVAETLFRRKALIKVVHNTAKEIVAVGVAAYLYTQFGGTYSGTEFSVFLPQFAIAAVAYFVVVNGGTALAVTLSTGTRLTDSWRELAGRELFHNVLSSSLAILLAFLYIELQVLGLFLVLVPIFFLRNVHRANLKLEQANRELLELMVKSIEARDPYTSGHSVRVAEYAKILAREVGLPGREVDQIETAALLHDVGKIFEEYAPLLQKTGKLSAEERALMRSHPVRSAQLVATISGLRGYVERCVRHHHENYAGDGYPDGLSGEEIPVGARIIMIADTTDAMTTDRPYRGALDYERVVLELQQHSGGQFDPQLVEAFCSCSYLRRVVEARDGWADSRVEGPVSQATPISRAPRKRLGIGRRPLRAHEVS